MAKKTVRKKAKRKDGARFHFRDERIVKIIGIACIFLGLYLAVAFTSYIFTWKADQDKVLALSAQLLFDGSIVVENWLGRFGAYISNLFFYWGFGLSSVGFIYLLVRLGIVLIRKSSKKKFIELLLQSVIVMAFIAIVLEFIFNRSEFSWGGVMGYATYTYLSNFLGQVGLALLFMLVIISVLIWMLNPILHIGDFSLSVPGVGSMPTWNQLTFKIGKAQTEEVKTLRPRKKPGRRLFGNIEGVIPKTDAPVEGSLSESEVKDVEFKLPDTVSTRPKTVLDKSAELEISDASSGAPAPQSNIPLQTVKTKLNREEGKLYVEEENIDDFEPYDPTKELSNYKFPGFDLLEDYSEHKYEIDRAELEANKDQIIETLLHYKIEITKIRATIGPTVTLYEIVPAPGVKISSIKKLEDDIALSLSALGIRIIAPIPGKGTIGIEVPNKKKQIVSFKEVVRSDKFQNAKMDLPVVLGKTISNEVFVADLAKMPHLLIAGATGQGKSVGINTILMSLLYKKHPSQVKLVMIDPKKVELFPYSYLDNHYLGFLPNEEDTIVTDISKVVATLNSLTTEMDDRYNLLKKARARNIKEYNAKFVARKLNPKEGHRFMPFIVLVIDEFADLILTAGKEVELPLARLAQLARAIGIHLIIATQRPSVKIITGMIKANFPARIAYKVTSQIDSRTIIDTKGADQLIGRGDMLLSVGSDIIRLQCAFVDTPELERVIECISNQKGFEQPFHLPEVKDESEMVAGTNLKYSDLDPMFEEAARLVIANQHGSTSMIQRKLQLGYNRAGRIMDQMEMLGIVGEARGSKPREVLYVSEMEFNHYMQHLKNQ